jgi:hypothetical protein
VNISELLRRKGVMLRCAGMEGYILISKTSPDFIMSFDI